MIQPSDHFPLGVQIFPSFDRVHHVLQILEPGRRERLGLKMANEAAAKNRAKKQEALRRVTENLAK